MSDRYKKLRENEDIVLKRTRTFLRESKSLVTEKEKKKAAIAKAVGDIAEIQEFINSSWQEPTSTSKTAILETVPLFFMLDPSLKKSGSEIEIPKKIDALFKQNYDWHPIAVEWFTTFFNDLSKKIDTKISAGLKVGQKLNSFDEDDAEWQLGMDIMTDRVYRYFFESCLLPVIRGGESLNDILGEKPTGFIHKNIDNFHKSFGTAAKESESKKFTADVILIYGGESVDKVLSMGEKGFTISDSKSGAAKLKADNKTRIVPVSLKADGRIGKVGESLPTTFKNFLEKELGIKINYTQTEKTEESKNLKWAQPMLSEGFFGDAFDALGDTISSIKSFAKEKLQKMKDAFIGVKNWFKGLIGKVTSIVRNFITKGKEEQAVQDKAETLIKEMLEEIEAIDESKEDMNKPAKLTVCFQSKLNELSTLLKYRGTEGDFDNIQAKMNELAEVAKKNSSKTNTFRISYPDANQPFIPRGKHFSSLEHLSEVYKAIKSAKPEFPPTPSKKCPPLKIQASINQSEITKNSIKTFLWQYANMKSIETVKMFVDDILGTILEREKETEKVRALLIQLCVDINSEAVFGNSNGLPLIKYDTGKVKRYGTRDDFSKESKQKLLSSFKKENPPPIVSLKINRTAAPYEKFGEQFMYYQIKMYILVNVDVEDTSVSDIPDSAFQYGVLVFKNNSGSGFTFAMEIDTMANGESVLKDLQSSSMT